MEAAALKNIARKEPELLISPQYFLGLAERLGNVRVDVLEKEGGYCNELNTYRYDVVIKLEEPASVNARFVEFNDRLDIDGQLRGVGNREPLVLDKYFNTRPVAPGTGWLLVELYA